MFARLRTAKRLADHLNGRCETARLRLPYDLRGKSLDELATLDDASLNGISTTHGAGVLEILMLIIAAWPLIKELWELFQEAKMGGEDTANTDPTEIKCEP